MAPPATSSRPRTDIARLRRRVEQVIHSRAERRDRRRNEDGAVANTSLIRTGATDGRRNA